MAISRIAFYHLETLLWIARLGTFGAAAERLNTTQPAISARVRELENMVGRPLFRRDGRTMSLTPAGRHLVRESEPLVLHAGDAVMTHDAKVAQALAAGLLEEGIYVIGFFFPVVPKGQARIRTQMSAARTREHLDTAIAAFTKVGKKVGLLK